MIASCCASRTQRGSAKYTATTNLATSVWGADGAFRQELPNAIPVLNAHHTRQMDKVGGYFVNLLSFVGMVI